MICPNCKQNVDLKKYCTKCGYRLDTTNTTSKEIFDSIESKEDFCKTWLYVILFIIVAVIWISIFC